MRSPSPVASLTVAQARRIALAAQGFADPRPKGRVDARHLRRVLDRIGLLQIDSVNVLVRSHELPVFARLGPYPRPLLTELIEKRRELYECWAHVASFVPVERHPLLRWKLGPLHARAEDTAMVLEEVRQRGPIAASQLMDGGAKSGPWWGWSKGKYALESLFHEGLITSAGRGPNFERRYDLTERVLPAAILALPTPSIEDAHRALLLLSAQHHGIGTARDLADYYRLKVTNAKPRLHELVEMGELEPVRVGDWKDLAYLYSGARRPRRIDAHALLSPFDPVIWERSRAERLFGAFIRIELYTPPPKRIHGYYVLPFLLGEELVARVDLKSDRKRSRLLVQGAFLEAWATADAVAPALLEELMLMAEWLGLDEGLEIAKNGDLAPALRRRYS